MNSGNENSRIPAKVGRHPSGDRKANGNLKAKNLLNSRNGRFLTFGILYISEGIPFGFTSIAMVAFMRQEGVSLEQIGAFGEGKRTDGVLRDAHEPAMQGGEDVQRRP